MIPNVDIEQKPFKTEGDSMDRWVVLLCPIRGWYYSAQLVYGEANNDPKCGHLVYFEQKPFYSPGTGKE
jgi:hypothetical protein